jgi:choline dehydrogenase-like flavoprotein
MSDLVVGSGPAGIAAALALRARGRPVILIDGGRRLAPATEALRARLAAAAGPADWDAAAARAWAAPPPGVAAGGIARHAAAAALMAEAETLAAPAPWFGLRASQAAGGLSLVWGAAVLPWAAADLAGWPVGPEALAPHYRAVAGFLPVAGRQDQLAALFPDLPMAGRVPLMPGPQGAALLAALDRAAPRLRAQGLVHGMARQAVEAEACRGCGLCLRGCPWGLVASTLPLLERLRADPGVSYQPGRIVTGFAEDAAGVTLRLADGTRLAGTRLFLAAGVLGTARIALASLPGPAELLLADSPQLFTPFLALRGTGDPRAAARHELALAFLELADPAVSPFLVHTQLYGWTEAYAREMRARYPLPFAGPLFDRLARRLIVAQSFLHSRHGPRIGLSLAPGDAAGRLRVRLVAAAEMAGVAAAVRRRLARGLRAAGLLALRPAARDGAPGSSFHCGGTLPMRAAPGPGETDALGRPAGLARVHIVDASVLPAIPATTITFPVMANAHRIAMAAP